MSVAQHTHEALARDPTGTKTIREEYARNLRGAYSRINTVIREYVGRRDILGLRNEALVSPPSSFEFDADDAKLAGFEGWLDEAQEDEVLRIINRGGNRYIERAYAKGITDADREIAREGGDIDPIDVVNARRSMAAPTHERKVRLIYTRNYRQLEGITNAVDQQVSRVLAEGISEGIGPPEMASRMADRVDSIGKTRATTLARTETINAHATASLERYRHRGVEEVVGEPEVVLTTAGDQRVCPECADLAGTRRTLDDAEGIIPVHANCRCAWSPVVNRIRG